MRIARNAWIVVCDGRKALIFENAGTPMSIKLVNRETLEHTETPTHQQGTDRPGRVQQSVGTARSAVEQTDWHERSERDFLRSLARHLDAGIAAGKLGDLVIVAPPTALGILRASYTPAVKQSLRGEIDKDYVKVAVGEIEKLLEAAG